MITRKGKTKAQTLYASDENSENVCYGIVSPKLIFFLQSYKEEKEVFCFFLWFYLIWILPLTFIKLNKWKQFIRNMKMDTKCFLVLWSHFPTPDTPFIRITKIRNNRNLFICQLKYPFPCWVFSLCLYFVFFIISSFYSQT